MAIIQVRPIEKEEWHGNSGLNSFTAPKVIQALVSLDTGKYATGLSQEDRTRLEKATGFDLSDNYTPGTPHPFWSSPAAKVVLENGTNIFKTENPLDEIKVSILKASDMVANSQTEYNEGHFPNAIFIIFDEEEEVEVKASKLAIKNKVIVELQKLSKDRKIEIVQILLGLSVRKQSEDYIDLKIDECIEKKGAEVVLDLINRDKTRTAVHSMIIEALYKSVLRKEGSRIYYMDDELGFDMESAIDYLSDKKNQALKVQILEKITD